MFLVGLWDVAGVHWVFLSANGYQEMYAAIVHHNLLQDRDNFGSTKTSATQNFGQIMVGGLVSEWKPLQSESEGEQARTRYIYKGHCESECTLQSE